MRTNYSTRRDARRGERGFSLLVTAAAAVVLVGMLGLAFDAGHMMIVKDELQTFADASAMAAVTQMDGTQTGIQTANNTATQGPLGQTRPNGWNFDVTTISNVTTKYSTSYSGTYDSYATASTPATNTYRFVSVTASASMPMYFLPIMPGISTSQTITATSIAGQQPQSSAWNGGLVPFAPDAHNATDTKNFGLTPGLQYTLKWGNGNSTTCSGDAGYTPPNSFPSAHGFVDLGQGNGNSSLVGVIEYGGYPNANSTPSSVAVGTELYSVPGNRGSSIFSALADRSNQDPDQTSTTWAAYRAAGIGNGRRIITAPINDPTQAGGNGSNFHYSIAGFGNFLLDIASNISGSSGPICATYIGPASFSGPSSGAADGTKIYQTVLYQ